MRVGPGRQITNEERGSPQAMEDPGDSEDSPVIKDGNQATYGHQALRNSVLYAPSHLLAWCRLDELNTNSCRAVLDKSQHPSSAP